jgi:hypothetical protein
MTVASILEKKHRFCGSLVLGSPIRSSLDRSYL